MSIFGAPGHDEKYSAAYAVKTILDMEHETDCFSFWCCNDLFEEIMFVNQPFHGGFGLINNLGIPKPVFWAFKLLAETYDKRLKLPIATDEPVEYAAFTDGHRYQVFAYAHDPDPMADSEFKVRIELSKKMKSMTVQYISDGHCDPKRIWKDIGSPIDPTPQQVKAICDGSRPMQKPLAFENTDWGSVAVFTIRSNDIAAIFAE